MKTYKFLIVFLASIVTAQTHSMHFLSIKPISTCIAKASHAALQAVRKHPDISSAIAAGALLAYPKTRQAIIREMRSSAARTCINLGLLFRSPRLLRLGAFCGANYTANLFEAVRNGRTDRVQALINAGVDPNIQGDHNNTPLHDAAAYDRTDTVQALIQIGANPSIRDNNNNTPLHYAAMNGNTNIVKALIHAGADPNIKGLSNATALHYAATFGFANIVQALVQAGTDVNLIDRRNRRAIDKAQECNNNEIVDYLGNLGHQATELVQAIGENNTAVARTLIEQGAPIHIHDEQGNSPVHLAIGAYDRANPTNLDTIARDLLHAGGPRICALCNAQGQTPLHLAAIHGNLRLARLLVSRRADINAQDNEGNAPLHCAENKEIRDQLLRNGADFSLLNHKGKTPISHNINLWIEDFVQRKATTEQ